MVCLLGMRAGGGYRVVEVGGGRRGVEDGKMGQMMPGVDGARKRTI